ncbi:hypothetical protein Tco_1564015 [Tanacetum coccineum]
MPPTKNESTKDVQPPVIPVVHHESISEPVNAPVKVPSGSFLAIEDDPTSSEVDPTYYDPDGDILLLEAILNSEPLPPLQGKYFPETRKDLKICEANNEKYLVNEPSEVELKDLPPHLEYAFLEERASLGNFLIQGINQSFEPTKFSYVKRTTNQRFPHQKAGKILKIHTVIKKEVEKLLDAGLIYPISDSPWVSPVHCVPKKGGMTVVKNDENDLIPTRLVTGWRVCIDYRKLNEATRKDHFHLPIMEPNARKTSREIILLFPYGRRLFRQSSIHDRKDDGSGSLDDFSVFGDSFSTCLSHLDKMLKLCEDTNLVLNWEKSRFMVKEGIVLGHKISKSGIKVDRAKVDVIAKLPHPTTVKGDDKPKTDAVDPFGSKKSMLSIEIKKDQESGPAEHLFQT